MKNILSYLFGTAFAIGHTKFPEQWWHPFPLSFNARIYDTG